MSSSLSAKQQSDYFWLGSSVTWTWPTGLPLFSKSIEVLGFKYSKRTYKKVLPHKFLSVWAELLNRMLDWFDLWHREERGEQDRHTKRERSWQRYSVWLWGGFQPCLFSTAQLQKGTVSIPLHPSLPGLQLIAALQKEKGRAGENRQTEKERDNAVYSTHPPTESGSKSHTQLKTSSYDF